MKHRKFPSPQISEAIFRGKKSLYNFEVYPLNIEFNPVAAVYIISHRKIDKYGRAHHQIVSVGQTESLAAEVKTQRRVKTVKDFQANTVSVLLTDKENSRLAIEEDLKAVYGLRCLRQPVIKKPVMLKPKKLTIASPKDVSLDKSLVSSGKTKKRATVKSAIQPESVKPTKVKKAETLKSKEVVLKTGKEKVVEPKLKSKVVKPKTENKVVLVKSKPKVKPPVKKLKKAEVAEPKKTKTVGRKTANSKAKAEKTLKSSKAKTPKQAVIQKAKTALKKVAKAKTAKTVSTKRSTILKPKKAQTKTTAKKAEKYVVSKKANKVLAKTAKGKTTALSNRTTKPKKQADVKTKAVIQKKTKTQKSVEPKTKTTNNKKHIVQVKAKAKKSLKSPVNKCSKNEARNRLAI